ncbi:MAG: hypothetical protein Q7T68_15745 [Sphingopyxis sp.]|nr:hypothetical protein [Sphingopyxis sp.]
MVRRRYSAAIRDSGAARLLRWLVLALAGTGVGLGGGMMLGELTIGNLTDGQTDKTSTFSSLSANPDALVPQGEAAPPCPDCSDSYGVAMRLHAEHDTRISDAFRELGAVDLDRPTPVDPDDGYRFGGRFPDPPRSDNGAVELVEGVRSAPPAADMAPTDQMPLATAEPGPF